MLQILCFLLVWLVAAPPPLSAQAPAAAPPSAPAASPEYQKLIDDGIQEFRRGNFAEARSLFARANGIHPNARTLRGLGMTELELGNYVDSAELLRSALSSQVRPLTATLRSETEASLARAESFIAQLTVSTTPVPPTRVLVDGSERTLGEGNVLLLTVGDRALELQATGYLPLKLTKKVQGGEKETLALAFQRPEPPPVAAVTAPLPAVTEPAAPALPIVPASLPARDDGPRRRPLYKNPWLWTGVGVLAAGAAVGLALGLRKGGGTDDPLVINPVANQKGP